MHGVEDINAKELPVGTWALVDSIDNIAQPCAVFLAASYRRFGLSIPPPHNHPDGSDRVSSGMPGNA